MDNDINISDIEEWTTINASPISETRNNNRSTQEASFEASHKFFP